MKGRSVDKRKTKPAYSRRTKHDRCKVIYGVSVRKNSSRHYCFNREYSVLQVELPQEALEAIKNSAIDVTDGGQRIGGGGMPDHLGDLADWTTYMVFLDKTAPDWKYDD